MREAWNLNVYMWSIRSCHLCIQRDRHTHYNRPFVDWKAPECSSDKTLDGSHRHTASSPTPSPRSWRANRVYSTLLWFFVLALLLAWAPGYTSAQRPPGFNLHQCRKTFDTSAQIHYVCYEHPDMFPILKYAEVVARQECERAFQNEEWNCTGFTLLKAPNISRQANKEAGYVRALSLTAIAHTVAKACKDYGQDLHSCSCESDPNVAVQTDSDSTVVEGCSDNVEFGLNFAEAFLNKSLHAAGHQEMLAHHNIRVGRSLFEDIVTDTPAHCHCHGYSGACTFRTCWGDLPEFTEIGERVKQAYSTDSCKVSSNRLNGAKHAWIPQNCPRVTERSILYSQETPDHCVANPYLGIPGVAGRVCDPDSDGPNSCEHLCTKCGLIAPAHLVTVSRQCDCVFQFCCDIICDTCTERRTVYMCSSSYDIQTDS